MKGLLVETLAGGHLAPTSAGAEARQADVVRLDGVRVELRAGTARVPVIAVAR